MRFLETVGRRLVAVGQRLTGDQSSPGEPSDPDRVERRVVGDIELRARRKDARLELDAVLDGQIVVHEKHPVADGADVAGLLQRLEQRLHGAEAELRKQMQAQAQATRLELDRLRATVADAERQLEDAARRRDRAREAIPGAEWAAARAGEWLARTEGRARKQEESLLRKLLGTNVDADTLRRAPFSEAWLEAAIQQRSGAWTTFEGSAGPGRADIATVVVARQPHDAIVHFGAAPRGDPVFYICRPGSPAGAEGPVLPDATAATVAAEVCSIAGGVGCGAPPRVVAVIGCEEDLRFAAEVARIAAHAGLPSEAWEVPQPQRTRSGRGTAPSQAAAETKSVVPRGDDSPAPAKAPEPVPEQAAGARAVRGSKPVFTVARPLLAKGVHPRVIGNPAFTESFVTEAVEELRTGKRGRPVMSAVVGSVKRVVFTDRRADALAFHQISGERVGSVYVVAGNEPLASVVAQDDVRKVLESPSVVIEAAFEGQKAGAARAGELRDAMPGRRVERREPTHGRYWFETLAEKTKAQGRGR